MKKIKKYKTKKRLIAYFDILGYKEMVRSEDFNENLLISRIKYLTEIVYDTKVMTTKWTKWRAYFFSDNYAIVVKYTEDGFVRELENLMYILRTIQCEFISLYGIMIRGAITHGTIFSGKKFIYGDGLIKAYEIENSVAIYPRIIIDGDLINKCLMYVRRNSNKIITINGITYNPSEINEYNMFQMFPRFILFDSDKISKKEVKKLSKIRKDEDLISMCQDFDKEYYIDFFQHFIYLRRNSSDADYYIKNFVNNIYRNISLFGEDNHVLKKYLWICHKANIFFNKFDNINLFIKSEIKSICKLDLDNINTDDNALMMLIKSMPL